MKKKRKKSPPNIFLHSSQRSFPLSRYFMSVCTLFPHVLLNFKHKKMTPASVQDIPSFSKYNFCDVCPFVWPKHTWHHEGLLLSLSPEKNQKNETGKVLIKESTISYIIIQKKPLKMYFTTSPEDASCSRTSWHEDVEQIKVKRSNLFSDSV